MLDFGVYFDVSSNGYTELDRVKISCWTKKRWNETEAQTAAIVNSRPCHVTDLVMFARLNAFVILQCAARLA